MVFYMLRITAELENLTNLQPMNGCDDPAFTYYFKVKCGCGDVSQKETCLSLSETVPFPKSKWTNLIQKRVSQTETCLSLNEMVPFPKSKRVTHLIQKCKFCDRKGMITMIPGKGRPLTLQLSEREKFAPLMLFDSRGFEPVDFMFGPGWKAKSVKGTMHEDIDLSDGVYSEYDENGKFPVTISSLRASFDVVKRWSLLSIVQ